METLASDLDPVLQRLSNQDGVKPDLPHHNIQKNDTHKMAELFRKIDSAIILIIMNNYIRVFDTFGYKWDISSEEMCVTGAC
jgi:hypothetical protein